ncbi:MAG TPA: glucose 1-dehydrogenase [Solirubrobacteraceae bacterium]|jgi:ketoreductase RED2|nr:glucose 1-dehydrogenase [Solirubrobacteraceae bacterium]
MSPISAQEPVQAVLEEPALTGRVALVTGSSRGIGEAVARAFAAAGASVVVNSRGAGAGEALAAELANARFVQADVAEQSGAEQLVETASREWGRLDYVINCAGVTRLVPLADLDAVTEADWEAALGVNVLGIWHVCRAAAPLLRSSGGGAIVNVTSAAGIRPSGSSIPYAVSKAAANHLTRLLARTLAPEIRVSAVAPGFIDTPLTASMPGEFREGYIKTAPLGHTGRPQDIAEACLFLARSSYATGDVVLIDGGLALT